MSNDLPAERFSGDIEPLALQNDQPGVRLRSKMAVALAEKSCTDLLSAALRRIQEADSVSPAQMAAQLGTDVVGLDRLALCRLPREEHFAQDVAKLADYCGCELSSLMSLLRRVQVLATFADPAVVPDAETTATASGQRYGFLGGAALVASRDADDPAEDTASEEGGSSDG